MPRISGIGRHVAYWLVTGSPDKIVVLMKLVEASFFLYMAGVTLPKVCILLLYLHLFEDRKERMATWAVLCVVVLNYIGVGLVIVPAVCRPFAYNWDKTIEGGECWDQLGIWRWISLPNIATDLCILALPIPMLWKLQASLMRKVGLFVTFLTGGLGIVVAVLRFHAFFTTYGEGAMTDITFYSVLMCVYTAAEPCAYFVCSCLPGTRPLLGTISKRLKSRNNNAPAVRNGSDNINFHAKDSHEGGGTSGSVANSSHTTSRGDLEQGHTDNTFDPINYSYPQDPLNKTRMASSVSTVVANSGSNSNVAAASAAATGSPTRTHSICNTNDGSRSCPRLPRLVAGLDDCASTTTTTTGETNWPLFVHLEKTVDVRHYSRGGREEER